MAYEYERDVVSELENLGVDYQSNAHYEMAGEVEEVYTKAKTLDKVKNFITERLKEQKLTDEYDFGERFMCEEIEEIIGGQINEQPKHQIIIS